MNLPAANHGSQPIDPDRLRSTSSLYSAPILEEDRLENLVVELHEALDLQQTMSRFLAFAVDFLACDHATIALCRRGRTSAAAATDAAAYAALLAQLDCGEGPCLTALSTGLSVLVPDTARESRWPRWELQATGGRSIFAIPLTISGSTLGVLTLIGDRPHKFNAADAKAPRVATYGAVAIASAIRQDSLLEAVEANRRIGQAVGILRERFRLDEVRAFAVLKRYSQDSNIKLRDIAQHMLDTGRLPDAGRNHGVDAHDRAS